MLNFDCLTGPMLGRKESNQKIIMHHMFFSLQMLLGVDIVNSLLQSGIN